MRRWPVVLGVLLVILGAVTAFGFEYTSRPSFCSSCHPIAPFRDSWEKSSHAANGVTCIDCHFEPGFIGYTKGKIYSLIKVTQWAAGQTDKEPEATRTVVAGACRQCHENPRATFIPHEFHTEVANLGCTECHSGVTHGPQLVGEERPQAAPDPAFCNNCHTGDIAPIIFGEIAPAGREHPGAPKIDVAVWRNIHWRMADAPAVIEGVPYDRIERDTCLACHQEPTQARACKGCHFARVPEFRPSLAAQQASGFPVAIFAVLFALLMVTVVLHERDKTKVFSSRFMQGLVGLIVLSDLVVVYFIVRDTLVRETGSVEIGPTTVWITYLLLSIAIVLLVLYEGIIRPGYPRLLLLPVTEEKDIYVPDHNLWMKQPEASTLVDEDTADPVYRFGQMAEQPGENRTEDGETTEEGR